MLVISKTDWLVNKEIVSEEVRLIDKDGNMLGIISTEVALKMAADNELDLVRIAVPPDQPPVCKLMDYSKYLYDVNKKQKESRKKQKQSGKVAQVKEIRVSITTEKHDFDVKVRQTQNFLSKGSKVKVVLRFKGREMSHTVLGQEVLKRFASEIEQVGIIEKQPNLEGRSMIMIISPKQ